MDRYTTVRFGDREMVTDLEMAEIVENLWRLGVSTGRANKPRSEAKGDLYYSTWGSIGFCSLADFVAFLDLFDETSLQWRRVTFWNRPHDSNRRTSTYVKWRYTTVVKPTTTTGESVTVTPAMYFPPEDHEELQIVLKQLLEARRSRQRPPIERHPTEVVTVGERTADIDVGLARIIESLWKLDINTRACCQEESVSPKRNAELPRGYILFESSDDLRHFLEVLEDTPIAEHRWQDFDWSDGIGSPLVELPPIGWSYDISVRRPGPKQAGIGIGANVRFPVSDIPLLEAILTQLVSA